MKKLWILIVGLLSAIGFMLFIMRNENDAVDEFNDESDDDYEQ